VTDRDILLDAIVQRLKARKPTGDPPPRGPGRDGFDFLCFQIEGLPNRSVRQRREVAG